MIISLDHAIRSSMLLEDRYKIILEIDDIIKEISYILNSYNYRLTKDKELSNELVFVTDDKLTIRRDKECYILIYQDSEIYRFKRSLFLIDSKIERYTPIIHFNNGTILYKNEILIDEFKDRLKYGDEIIVSNNVEKIRKDREEYLKLKEEVSEFVEKKIKSLELESIDDTFRKEVTKRTAKEVAHRGVDTLDSIIRGFLGKF